MKNIYPSWRYHKIYGEKLVMNEQEDHEMSRGWVHSPAHFEENDDLEVRDCTDTVDKENIESPRRRGRPRKS